MCVNFAIFVPQGPEIHLRLESIQLMEHNLTPEVSICFIHKCPVLKMCMNYALVYYFSALIVFFDIVITVAKAPNKKTQKNFFSRFC